MNAIQASVLPPELLRTLKPTTVRLQAYGSRLVAPKGVLTLPARWGNTETIADFYVVGDDWIAN